MVNSDCRRQGPGSDCLGASFREVIEKAYAGVEKIKFPDAHFRRDIGGKIFKDREKYKQKSLREV